MQIVVLGNKVHKNELIQDTTDSRAEVIWIDAAAAFLDYRDAGAFIDLQFENTEERKSILKQLLPGPVLINSVTHTLSETHASFIRIAAWPTFLQGAVVEGACLEETKKEEAERALKHFGKTIEWLPDVPGFITPRVVCMIINEAYLALEEGVSTKEEIDTAMKLGTAYPFGPFEWCEKIGLENIVALLQTLSKIEPRYTPAPLLQREKENLTPGTLLKERGG